MGLPRTFVGFSSTDIHCYRLMQAWKAHEHIDFNFVDCQLPNAINSDDEQYVKRCLRERIDMAGRYAMLIGDDTKFQRKFVPWEAEVAREKGCVLIGVNLDGARRISPKCPSVLRGVGAVFVPFSPKIVAHALQNYGGNKSEDWQYPAETYTRLGYR